MASDPRVGVGTDLAVSDRRHRALQSNVLAWLTPIAIILVIVAGGLAMTGRASWGWFIGLVIGIPIALGAPQIVTWVRGMFGT